MSECVYEKGGSKKYRLTATYLDLLHFGPKKIIRTDYCHFNPNGGLLIENGYEWDGPSGPAIDTDNFMDGSLVHDLLYQLMREGYLSRWKYRRKADKEMRLQTKKDDMFILRQWWTWLGVRLGGHRASGGWFFGRQ